MGLESDDLKIYQILYNIKNCSLAQWPLIFEANAIETCSLGELSTVPFGIDFTQTSFLTNAATKGGGAVKWCTERTPTHPGKEMRTSER